MKKSRLLNSDITSIIGQMGHMDEISIGDAGLPIPPTTTRIDLAVEKGLPSMLAVLEVVLSELQVEAAIIAQECRNISPEFHQQLLALLASQPQDIAIRYVSHEDFKQRTRHSRTVIRTGEFTPYANIILVSGVVF